MRKPCHIVLTTIRHPEIVNDLYANIHRHGHLDEVKVWIVGNKKTPPTAGALAREASRKGLETVYFDVLEQDEWGKGFPFYKLIPYNTDGRRVFGYLKAMDEDCEILIAMDDDKTLDQIEAEVKALAEIGVTALRVWDDTITIKEKRCRDMADIFHHYGMLWRGWSRVNLMNPELFRYLAARGCTEMGFGVEHGSAGILKAMNKGTTPEANTKGIKICQDSGIVARAYLLIGFPGETWETIEEMRLWLDTTRPDAASLHMFQPYPGSQVWSTPERFGIELPEDAFSQMWELNDDDPKTLVLDLPTMTKDELFQARTQLHEWIVDNISLRLANR